MNATESLFTRQTLPNMDSESFRRNPWEALISHWHCVDAGTTLVAARNLFRQYEISFMAVVRGREVLGLCSYAQISEVLSRGHQGLGFSIYERRPVGDFILPDDFRITLDASVHQVFNRLSERDKKHFFDDIVVLDNNNQYRGIITAHDMVHFQQSILKEQHAQLEKNIQELEFLTTKLNDTNQQLESLNEEKNEFLGIAAHDLKNPINIISMSVELILSDPEMQTEEQQQLLKDVSHSCDRMTKLLGDLLDINRIENKKMRIDLEPCDIEELVLSMLEYYQIQAQKKQIQIHYHSEQEAPTILVDHALLMQVMENLVSNAIKFSPQNKKIIISVGTSAKEGWIRIQDEGPGFTEADKKKIFQKFSRLSAKPTGNENSTGLGLSIVKRLVEAMDGTISLETAPHTGACFTLHFPRS